MLCPRRFKVAGDDVFGLCDRPGGVAAGDVSVCLNVVFPLVVDALRAVARLLGRVDDGQGLIFDLHELFRLFERGFILRNDQRDRVAEVVHQPADGDERILVFFQMPDLILPLGRDVLRREHGEHAGQRLCAAGVDGQHARAGVFGTHRAAVGHAGHIPVVGVFAVAQHFFFYVQPVDARAELPVGFGRPRHAAELFILCCQTHGGENFDVARAAAIVVAQGVFNIRLRGVGVFIQQCLGAQHHARDAEAALHRAGFAVAVGVKLLFPVGKALHGDDVPPIQRVGIGRAGADGVAVNNDRARAARALRAAVFDARQMQHVAQIAQQLHVLFGAYLLPVDKENRHRKHPFSAASAKTDALSASQQAVLGVHRHRKFRLTKSQNF